MGLGKASVFAIFAMFPGALLSLFAYMLIGAPETWSGWMAIPCYGPFFGCVGVGIWLGLGTDEDVELEA
jgi:hypothetical protein